MQTLSSRLRRNQLLLSSSWLVCADMIFQFAAHDIVANWVIAENSDLTETQRKERKELAVTLAENIRFYKMSLRALVVLSQRNVFPMEFLVKLMQSALEFEMPFVNEVKYAFHFTHSQVQELEFEDETL